MKTKIHLKRLLKFLHTMSTIGLTGGVAAYIILLIGAPDPLSLEEYAAVRHGIERIAKWMLLPSLAIVLASGLLAIAAHEPYMRARWAWLKAALGLSMFEGTLSGIQGPAEHGAAVTARALTGALDPARVPELMRDEWGTLWFILTLAAANVALAIWRPRLRRRGGPDRASQSMG